VSKRTRQSVRARQRGQSMAEYLVVAAIATALVAVPISGHGSVIRMMLAAVREGWAKFLAALSLPM
jgi:uncharacterized membrane protein